MTEKVQGDPDDLPAYSPDGVDLTLIRWFLTLTPEERLDQLQGAVNSLESMRELMTDVSPHLP